MLSDVMMTRLKAQNSFEAKGLVSFINFILGVANVGANIIYILKNCPIKYTNSYYRQYKTSKKQKCPSVGKGTFVRLIVT